MRWKYLLLFYIKKMTKSKLYVGASVLFFVLLISRMILFFSSPFDIEQYGQLPGEVAVIVQFVSLFYIVFFYRTHSNELLYGVHSFFVDGYRILLEKISAMLAAHLMIQTGMLVFAYGLFAGIYVAVGIEPSDFYLSLFRFLLVYMMAPLLLCVLYGVAVALLFGTKKISFFFILLVWIGTGSVSTELFFPFFSTVRANEWRALLFIGLNNVQHVYKSYIGFGVHWGNELKLVTWFLVTMGMILLLSLRWALSKRERHFAIIMLLVMISFSILTAYGVMQLSSKHFNRADFAAETDFYLNLNEAETDLRYEIESYLISLEGNRATARVNFSSLDTMEPTFQLYHAYPLMWIKAGDEPVQYERRGDVVKVFLPRQAFSLTFRYDIVDTSFVPYTNGRVALLADKAWYPQKRAGHMFQENEFHGGVDISEPVFADEHYDFTLEVEEVLFCNLPRHGQVYKGEAQAVTLIKGQGNQLTYGDYHITYPADWPKMKERVPTVLAQLEITIYEVQQLAPVTVQSLPKAIVFSNYGLTSVLTTDHLVYNTNYGDAVDSYDTMKDFQEKILQLSVPRKSSYMMHREWINFASRFIRQKNGWPVNYIMVRSAESFSLPNAEQEKIERIYHYFYQLNVEEQQQFLREWYEAMDDEWTWDQVLELLKEWR